MAWLAGLTGALDYGAPQRAFWVFLIVGVLGGGAVVWPAAVGAP